MASPWLEVVALLKNLWRTSQSSGCGIVISSIQQLGVLFLSSLHNVFLNLSIYELEIKIVTLLFVIKILVNYQISSVYRFGNPTFVLKLFLH